MEDLFFFYNIEVDIKITKFRLLNSTSPSQGRLASSIPLGADFLRDAR